MQSFSPKAVPVPTSTKLITPEQTQAANQRLEAERKFQALHRFTQFSWASVFVAALTGGAGAYLGRNSKHAASIAVACAAIPTALVWGSGQMPWVIIGREVAIKTLLKRLGVI